jgi:hypothetical protein
VVVTIRVVKGTHALHDTIRIRGFYGGGDLVLEGETTAPPAAKAHTAQETHLDGSALAGTAILVEACNLSSVAFRHLKVSYNAKDKHEGLRSDRNAFTSVDSCYFVGNSTEVPGSKGIYVLWHPCYIVRTCFTAGYSAIKGTELALVKVDKCSVVEPLPRYGVEVEDALAFIEGPLLRGSAAPMRNERGGLYTDERFESGRIATPFSP